MNHVIQQLDGKTEWKTQPKRKVAFIGAKHWYYDDGTQMYYILFVLISIFERWSVQCASATATTVATAAVAAAAIHPKNQLLANCYSAFLIVFLSSLRANFPLDLFPSH